MKILKMEIKIVKGPLVVSLAKFTVEVSKSKCLI